MPILPAFDSRVIESTQMESKPVLRNEKQKMRFKARRRELRKAASDLVKQRKVARGEVDKSLQSAPPQSAPSPSQPVPSAQPLRVPQGNLQSGQAQQQQRPPAGRGGRGGVQGMAKKSQPQPQAPEASF